MPRPPSSRRLCTPPSRRQASTTSISRAGSLFSVAFRADPVRDYDDARAQEAWRYPPFFHAMLDAGVSLPPSVFEAWFLTAAHDEEALGRVSRAHPRTRCPPRRAAPAGRPSALRPAARYTQPSRWKCRCQKSYVTGIAVHTG